MILPSFILWMYGNPLQCSCLENPRDGGVWWPPIYGVAQSQTRLKWLSSSSSSSSESIYFASRILAARDSGKCSLQLGGWNGHWVSQFTVRFFSQRSDDCYMSFIFRSRALKVGSCMHEWSFLTKHHCVTVESFSWKHQCQCLQVFCLGFCLYSVL